MSGLRERFLQRKLHRAAVAQNDTEGQPDQLHLPTAAAPEVGQRQVAIGAHWDGVAAHAAPQSVTLAQQQAPFPPRGHGAAASVQHHHPEQNQIHHQSHGQSQVGGGSISYLMNIEQPHSLPHQQHHQHHPHHHHHHHHHHHRQNLAQQQRAQPPRPHFVAPVAQSSSSAPFSHQHLNINNQPPIAFQTSHHHPQQPPHHQHQQQQHGPVNLAPFPHHHHQQPSQQANVHPPLTKHPPPAAHPHLQPDLVNGATESVSHHTVHQNHQSAMANGVARSVSTCHGTFVPPLAVGAVGGYGGSSDSNTCVPTSSISAAATMHVGIDGMHACGVAAMEPVDPREIPALPNWPPRSDAELAVTVVISLLLHAASHRLPQSPSRVGEGSGGELEDIVGVDSSALTRSLRLHYRRRAAAGSGGLEFISSDKVAVALQLLLTGTTVNGNNNVGSVEVIQDDARPMISVTTIGRYTTVHAVASRRLLNWVTTRQAQLAHHHHHHQSSHASQGGPPTSSSSSSTSLPSSSSFTDSHPSSLQVVGSIAVGTASSQFSRIAKRIQSGAPTDPSASSATGAATQMSSFPYSSSSSLSNLQQQQLPSHHPQSGQRLHHLAAAPNAFASHPQSLVKSASVGGGYGPAAAASQSTSSSSRGADVDASDGIEELLSAPSAREKAVADSSAELRSLLTAPTAKQTIITKVFQSAGGSRLREFCAAGTASECCRINATITPCSKVHFRKIILPHTDESLGDCSYLDTCRHKEACKFVHYEVDLDLVDSQTREGVVNGKARALERPHEIGAVSASRIAEVPAQWINCDLRKFDFSILTNKVKVVMADPPWDIHMALPYGTMMDQEMLGLRVDAIHDEGLLFLWVTGRAMELGRECMQAWGYRRIEEIIWLKTNQLQRVIRTGRTGHWVNHSKEHCLVGIKGSPKLNAQVDCDVIVAEVRETSRKPDEIYRLIERMMPGCMKVELFGRQHNVRQNWITLGNQLEGTRLHDSELAQRYDAAAVAMGLPLLKDATTAEVGDDGGANAPNGTFGGQLDRMNKIGGASVGGSIDGNVTETEADGDDDSSSIVSSHASSARQQQQISAAGIREQQHQNHHHQHHQFLVPPTGTTNNRRQSGT